MEGFKVLGVDVALTRSGWAIADNQEKLLGSGFIGGKAAWSWVRRGRVLKDSLAALVEDYRPDVAYVEFQEELGGKRDRSHAVPMALGAAVAWAEEALDGAGVPSLRIAPSKWREIVVGNARANKQATWLALTNLFYLPAGNPLRDWWLTQDEHQEKRLEALKASPESDEADAIAIALAGVRLERIARMAASAKLEQTKQRRKKSA